MFVKGKLKAHLLNELAVSWYIILAVNIMYRVFLLRSTPYIVYTLSCCTLYFALAVARFSLLFFFCVIPYTPYACNYIVISGVARILCQGAQVWRREKTENNKCMSYHPRQHCILLSMCYCIRPVCHSHTIIHTQV